MATRRGVLSAIGCLALAACSSSETTKSAPSGTSPAPSESPQPSADGATKAQASGTIVVFLPGALATQVKPLTEAYQAAGLGEVTFEVGHTPVQREQLAKGATPDIWIAANPDDMKQAAEDGAVVAGEVAQLARTKLGIVVPADNPAKIASLADLAKPGTKVLLAAETLPIWKATAKALEKLEKTSKGTTAKIVANAVSREMGVQPIVTKIGKGVADAGIVFVTDVAPDRTDVKLVEIPDATNAMLPFSIAPVTAGKNPEQVQGFMDFMLTGAGHEALAKAGFLPPEGA